MLDPELIEEIRKDIKNKIKQIFPNKPINETPPPQLFI